MKAERQNPFHNTYEFAEVTFLIDCKRPARRGDWMPSQRSILEQASQKLFKHSPNGLGLAPLDAKGNFLRGVDNNDPVWGIAITGIVEGTEIEGSRKLMFPFNTEQFWQEAQSLANELDDAESDWKAQGGLTV